MKKTIVTVFVALLVMLAVVSCDSGLIKQRPDTDDGLVTLKINTDGTEAGRSLTHALALLAANHIEVIFRKQFPADPPTHPTPYYKYYRAEGNLIETLYVKIPTGNYQPEDAIILIGRNGDKTLLATGMLDVDADEFDGGVLVVDASINSIHFKARSLTAELRAKRGVSDTWTPSFVIDTATGAPPLAGQGFTADKTSITHDGGPWFQVPKSTGTIGASLTIGGFEAATGYQASGPYIVRSGGTAPVTINGIGTGVPTIDDNSVTPADGDPIGTGVIAFTFSTKATMGEYDIIFEVPVVGYAKGIVPTIGGTPVVWKIRGGTVIGAIDIAGNGNEAVAILVNDDPNLVNIGIVPGGGYGH